MIGGEIEGNAGAEGDRHPGQQAAGAGFGANPFAQLVEQRDQAPKPDGAKPPACAASRGGQVPAIALRPAALPRSAIRPPYAYIRDTMLPRRDRAGKSERMQNLEKVASSCRQACHGAVG